MIDWDELDLLLAEQWDSKAFKDLGYELVPGEGDDPIAFIVGEAPGAQEAIQRRPFVGPAGVAMRDLMEIAGLSADPPLPSIPEDGWQPNCWLTNVVKFRPPGNRNPTDSEIAAARPYLRREWLAVGSPQIIIPTGGIALRAITGKKQSILRAAGKLHLARSKEGAQLYVWPMVHPSFGIRTPAVRPLLEKDWEVLGAWLKNAYKG